MSKNFYLQQTVQQNGGRPKAMDSKLLKSNFEHIEKELEQVRQREYELLGKLGRSDGSSGPYTKGRYGSNTDVTSVPVETTNQSHPPEGSTPYEVVTSSSVVYLTPEMAQDMNGAISEKFGPMDSEYKTGIEFQVEEIPPLKASDFTGLVSVSALALYMFYESKEGRFNPDKVKESISGYTHTNNGKMLTNLIGPMIFGFLDNFGMMIGLEVVEKVLKKTGLTDVTVLSMLGNTISDGIGSLAGSSIQNALVAHTAYDGDGDTLMELAGISIGCLIPAAMKIWQMDRTASVKDSSGLVTVCKLFLASCMFTMYYLWKTGKKSQANEKERQSKIESGTRELFERWYPSGKTRKQKDVDRVIAGSINSAMTHFGIDESDLKNCIANEKE